MDVLNFLREEFRKAWNKKSSISAEGFLTEIQNVFNVSALHENVNKRINEDIGVGVQERYQSIVLRSVVVQYVNELYKLSASGIMIDESIALKAKTNLKNRGCPIHPC